MSEEFTFQPNASDKLYMEQVHSIALDAMKVVEDGLAKYGIKMTDEQEDHIYMFIDREVERFSNGEYRNYN